MLGKISGMTSNETVFINVLLVSCFGIKQAAPCQAEVKVVCHRAGIHSACNICRQQ